MLKEVETLLLPYGAKITEKELIQISRTLNFNVRKAIHLFLEYERDLYYDTFLIGPVSVDDLREKIKYFEESENQFLER